jgi:hypothetical protein
MGGGVLVVSLPLAAAPAHTSRGTPRGPSRDLRDPNILYLVPTRRLPFMRRRRLWFSKACSSLASCCETRPIAIRSSGHMDAVRGRPRPRFGSGLEALLTLDPEPDQRTDRGAELDSLLVRQIAQVCNLDVASDLLVHCQRIDDTKWCRSGAGVPAPRWGLDP